MKRTSKWIAVTTAAALCALPAMAAEIYKYTDENGNVHYGDRPSGNAQEETVYVASQRTNNAAVQAAYSERYKAEPEAQSPAEQTAAEEPEQKLTRAERRAAAAERAKKCESYRARMETVITARRLYRQDENGERVYLEENERQETRDKIQELIEEYCD
ncbi:MAG: DUF4124 domain-containing protein [Woeseiaceae bacterium]|nr:DUF4124 domain-containing protein [Woeseiaceae bacterium]